MFALLFQGLLQGLKQSVRRKNTALMSGFVLVTSCTQSRWFMSSYYPTILTIGYTLVLWLVLQGYKAKFS